MKSQVACVLAIALGGCSTAQPSEPNVFTIAPGTARNVSLTPADVDLPALEALLATKGRMQDVANMIGNGTTLKLVPGTETHMYRLDDIATKRKVTVVIFVQNGRVKNSTVNGG